MEHTLMLYLHILSAALLVGSSAAARRARRVLLDASQQASLRAVAEVSRRISLANPVFAMLLLASGLYLGSAGFWSMAWFWVALAAWVANLALAAMVLGPAGARLGMAAARAGDGAIPPHLDALRRARAPALAADAMIGLDLGVLLLMVAKPTAVAAIVWPLLAVGAMLALGLAATGLAARRAEAAA